MNCTCSGNTACNGCIAASRGAHLLSRTNGEIGYVDIALHVSGQCPIDTTMAQMRVLLAAGATEQGITLKPIELEWGMDHAMRNMESRRDPFLHPVAR